MLGTSTPHLDSRSHGLVRLLLLAILSVGTAGRASAFTSHWDAMSGIFPDQMTCPWTKVDNSTNEPQFQGGSLVLSTTSVETNMYYRQSGAQLSFPSDSLVVEFKVRYVSGATSSSARAPISVVLQPLACRGTGFFVGQGEIFFTSANVTRGGTAAVPTSDTAHTYRIVIVGGVTMRIYQDGVLKLTGSTYLDCSVFSGAPNILWGEGSSLAYGTSEWVSFTHNAAPGGNCSVPTATAKGTWGGIKALYR